MYVQEKGRESIWLHSIFQSLAEGAKEASVTVQSLVCDLEIKIPEGKVCF
jgi:hypothetical protein